jgi:hypothetical protein
MNCLRFLPVCFVLLVVSPIVANAAYVISPFSNGTFCSSTYPTAYQSGSFSITETNKKATNGFTKGQTSVTLIIGFNGSGFQFNPGVGTVTVNGTEITIISTSITSTTITVTFTTASLNNEYNTITFSNVQIRATAAGSSTFLARTGGTCKIDNKTNKPSSTTSWGTLIANSPVAYSSSTSTQAVTSSLFTGTTDNEVIGVQVTVTGTCSSIAITQFNFNTTGSTNPTADIANAKLYYTATTNAFSTTTLYGSASAPNGAFSISGTLTLTTAGTYYFWLSYDINSTSTAINGDVIDAQFSSVVIGGTTKTPTVTSPSGTRTISSNVYYSIAAGSWTNTTTVWSRTSGGTSCSCTPNAGNGLVYVRHSVTLDATRTIDILTIESGGNLTNGSGSSLTVSNSVSTTGTGSFTASSAWTLASVSISGTGTSGSSVSQTISSNLTVSNGATFQMSAASGTTLTVNGNLTVDGTLSLSGNNATISNAAGTFIAGIGSITGTGTITLGTAKTISSTSTLTINPVLAISSGVTITNKGSVTLNNNITGAHASTSVWVNDASSTLTMSGTTSTLLSTGTLTATASGNTISFSGSGNQTIKGTTYNNLTAGGSNTKTLGANTTVNTALTITGSAQLATGSLTLTIGGQWINNSTNATPLSSSGTVSFTGSACSMTGSASTTFSAINISGTLTSHATTGKVIVTGNWTNDGEFDSNSSDITFNGTTTLSGASTTEFNNVVINASKTLSLSSSEMYVKGNLTVDGSLSLGTGLILFSGTGSTQAVGGTTSSLSFYKCEIDNSNGSVQLNKAVTVTNTLTLTAGLINTSSTNILTINNNVTLTGGSSTSYINGPLVHVVTSSSGTNTYTRVFPIGKSSDYRPVTLTIQTAGVAMANYTAELLNASAAALNYAMPSGIYSACDAHYWTITQSSGTNFTNAQVQLSYEASDNVTDPTHLQIIKNVGGGTSWVSVGGSGSAVTSGTITSSTFTSFSTFSLGNTGLTLLPIELTEFKAAINGDEVDLHWETASEKNNEYFTIEKSKDGKTFEEMLRVAGAGTSREKSVYNAVDPNPFSGRSYYRLKQTDYNNDFKYSDIISVSYNGEFAFSVYPNPAPKGVINVRISGQRNDEVIVSLNDTMGELIYSGKLTLKHENEILTLSDLTNVTPGLYVLTVCNAEFKNSTRVIVIQ